MKNMGDNIRQLDRQLLAIREAIPSGQPPHGWIRTIRDALGMSLETFGRQLGVTRATAHQIERAELDESISLKRLRAAATALDCDLIIRIVPRTSLEGTLHQRAYNVARQEVARVNHSMLLEGQAIYDRDFEELVEEVAADLIKENNPKIWTSG